MPQRKSALREGFAQRNLSCNTGSLGYIKRLHEGDSHVKIKLETTEAVSRSLSETQKSYVVALNPHFSACL